ncbi:MAG: hypothetical protein EXR75_13105 [Myxococcales bacterium]|nr:hypothetical protein [Myxococcales bacterium]
MGKPAAKQGDKVVGIDTHVLMVPSPAGPVPTPTPTPFNGILCDGLSSNVLIENMPAAMKGSTAQNIPPHLPIPGPFQSPPNNKATVDEGSASVLINDKPAARMGDKAKTCDDLDPSPHGTVIAAGARVLVG